MLEINNQKINILKLFTCPKCACAVVILFGKMIR